MKKLYHIIVVEPSLMISEGICALIYKSGLSCNISTINSLDELLSSHKNRKCQIAIVNPSFIQNNPKLLTNAKMQCENTHWIALVYAFFDEFILAQFEDSITISDTPESILFKIDNTNLVYELELAPEVINVETEWEKEKKIGVDLALAYSFNPNFAITIENVYNNVIENGEVEHSALYSGVGFSYVLDKFWANFTVLPQVKSFKGHSAGDTTNLNKFEKAQFRLLFSYVF